MAAIEKAPAGALMTIDVAISHRPGWSTRDCVPGRQAGLEMALHPVAAISLRGIECAVGTLENGAEIRVLMRQGRKADTGRQFDDFSAVLDDLGFDDGTNIVEDGQIIIGVTARDDNGKFFPANRGKHIL